MRVPLLDLKEQLLPLREEIRAAMTQVLDSTCYILGPEVEQFEKHVADYCGVGHAIGVASGTDALLATLMGLDIKPGDLVLTTPYSFFATMGSILRLGARPLFVDIDPVSYNIDPQKMADLLAHDPQVTSRIKAIMPVHLYGQCADMSSIMALARQYGIPVVEDAAQAIGASCPVTQADGSVQWQQAGAIGLAGCFSFFPSKNLGGVGDGGMIVCNDDQFAKRLRIIRVHGSEPKYHHQMIGGNFRIDPLQTVVLDIKLRHLPAWHRMRRDNARLYDQLFAEHGLVKSGAVELPRPLYAEAPGAAEQDYHIYNQYVIRARNRDGLKAYLDRQGVITEIYYPIPLHRQQCLQGMGYEQQSMPEAEKAAVETLALPIYPELTDAMQHYVVEQVAAFYKE